LPGFPSRFPCRSDCQGEGESGGIEEACVG
jgi:hypothetical protein